MSAPLKIKIKYKSTQQNMGENLVFIPHQILIFGVEIFGGALRQPQNSKGNFWETRGLLTEIFKGGIMLIIFFFIFRSVCEAEIS